MEKKKKLSTGVLLQEIEVKTKTVEEPLTSSDISTMRDVIIQFRDEADNEDGLFIVFHVSILWSIASPKPGIKVSIRLKDENEDDNVASWDRVMHKENTVAWEMSLGRILQTAKEMKIDYLILENEFCHNQNHGWLQ